MNSKTFDRKDQLIASALDEFIDNNYEQASLNTIIKNANLSKGVFYYHFKNKEALYIALLEDATNKKWEYIKAHTNNQEYAGLNVFDQFLYQTEISINFANEYPKYHRLGGMLLKEKGTPIYKKALEHVGGSGIDILEKMIKEAYDRGDIDNKYPIDFTLQLLTHLFYEFDSIFYFEDDNLQKKKDVLKHYYAFMRHGLMP
ncbi:TetR/AcrR family transcriptional regulator [Fusibacter ferrireducens]|uniref:TetR/AcrR family transcriptional regulator n=1 Tax=Fusibacter ferrireducens TaxID=2785058 RepID=A0ABR9ZQE2_9FIRM|nr:TetR/AcrR family transcriptional regulator [Fusibacter ferrireducens]MBF4692145.1 TetR/AcrR family transcriptional regulator [Fusibacter ferrireducens]